MNLKCLLGFHDWICVEEGQTTFFAWMAFVCPQCGMAKCNKSQALKKEFNLLNKERLQLESTLKANRIWQSMKGRGKI